MDTRLFAFLAAATAICLLLIAEGHALFAGRVTADLWLLMSAMAGWWRTGFVVLAIASCVVAVLVLEMRRVPYRWEPLRDRPLEAERRHDRREVAKAVVSEEVEPAVAVAALLLLGFSLVRSGETDFWKNLARLDFDQGRGTVVVGAVTVIIAVFGYLLRMRRTRLHVAQAVLREIRIRHLGNVNSANWRAVEMLVAQVPPVAPIVALDAGEKHVLQGQKDSLTLLPGALLEAVISFYLNDNFVAQCMLTLNGAAFSAASSVRRMTYVRNLNVFWRESYKPSAERAIYRLTVYCKLRTLLPL